MTNKKTRGFSISTNRLLGFIIGFLGGIFYYTIMFIYYQFVKKKYPRIKSYKEYTNMAWEKKDRFTKLTEVFSPFIGIVLLYLLLRWIMFS